MVLSAVVAACLVTTALAACPSDQWLTNDGNCYWISAYKASWENARKACQTMDPAADLTSISHLLENSFIVEKLGAEYAWIGLNDHMHDREFLWSDHSVVEFLYWAPNQPDNLLFKQHCVQIYDKLSGEWDDEDCSVEKTFVCKLTGAA